MLHQTDIPRSQLSSTELSSITAGINMKLKYVNILRCSLLRRLCMNRFIKWRTKWIQTEKKVHRASLAAASRNQQSIEGQIQVLDLLMPVETGNFLFLSWEECIEGEAVANTGMVVASPMSGCTFRVQTYWRTENSHRHSWAVITLPFLLWGLYQGSFSQGPCWFK